jgi:uncharacterized membrane protein
MMSMRLNVAALAVCALAGSALGQASITPITNVPNQGGALFVYHLSADGTTVAGDFDPPNGDFSEGFWFQLPNSFNRTGSVPTAGTNTTSGMKGASNNGQFLCGYTRYNPPTSTLIERLRTRAARYETTTGNWVVVDSGGTISRAQNITPDGTIMVGGGNALPSGDMLAAKWRVNDDGTTIYTALGLVSGDTRSEAYDVSNDGQVIVGISQQGTSPATAIRPVVFAPGGLGATALPLQNAADVFGEASAVSGTGNTIVGYTAPSGGIAKGMIWRRNGATWSIDGAATGPYTNDGSDGRVFWTGVSGDGSVVVGNSQLSALYYTQAGGIRLLSDVFAAAGIDMNGWILFTADSISDDGRTIIGTGKYASEDVIGFIARLPAPGTGGCNAADITNLGGSGGPDGQLSVDDLIKYLNWFLTGDIRADLTNLGGQGAADGQLTADDLIKYLNLFLTGTGC